MPGVNFHKRGEAKKEEEEREDEGEEDEVEENELFEQMVSATWKVFCEFHFAMIRSKIRDRA